MQLTKHTVFILLIYLLSACTDSSNQIYIDANKKAIISCEGKGLYQVDIDGPDSSITYNSFMGDKGGNIIYFNKVNEDFRITTSYNTINNSYIFRLKPNSTYEIWSRTRDGDQGPCHSGFKTDKESNIIDDPNNHNN